MTPHFLTITRKPGSKQERPHLNLSRLLEECGFEIMENALVVVDKEAKHIGIWPIPKALAFELIGSENNKQRRGGDFIESKSI